MGFQNPTADPRFPFIYNVTQAVGRAAQNFPDDVKLVQYMLKFIYSDPRFQPPAGTIVVDGFCGPITMRYILKFQKDIKSLGKSISLDQRVDRARSVEASISHTTYTVIWLNVTLKEVNPAAFAVLPNFVPLTPAEQVGPPTSEFPPESPEVPDSQIPATGGF